MSHGYEPLKKLFYKDVTSDRYSANRRLAQQRLMADGAFRTGIILGEDELFLATPRELSLASERVLRREREVERLWAELPHVAQGALIRSLILDEVQSSNEIEGVRSTRKEIQAALDVVRSGSGSAHVPYAEFARLYLNMTEGHAACPARIEDIRDIYDSVAAGAVASADLPDGRLFRKGPVCVSNGIKAIHEGVMPEERIEAMLAQMIGLTSSALVPTLYAALLSHLVFEYVHPFYDGNGRAGRYLLSLYLAQALSMPTVLSVTRAIAEDKSRYYRAFAESQHPMNHAEGTFFVLDMLAIVERAQESLLGELRERAERLADLLASIGDAADALGLSSKALEVLGLSVQLDVFSSDRKTWVADVRAHLGCTDGTARKYLRELDEAGYLEQVSRRPLAYVVSSATWKRLGFRR